MPRQTNGFEPQIRANLSRTAGVGPETESVSDLMAIQLFDRVANICGRALAIDVDDLGRREAVEMRRRGVRIRTDVFAVDKVAEFQVGQFLGQRNRIESIARRTEDRTNLRRAAIEGLEMILDVIEDHARERVINAVVDVVALFPVADRFADDAGDCRGRRGDEEPARFGHDFDFVGEQAL